MAIVRYFGQKVCAGRDEEMQNVQQFKHFVARPTHAWQIHLLAELWALLFFSLYGSRHGCLWAWIYIYEGTVIEKAEARVGPIMLLFYLY